MGASKLVEGYYTKEQRFLIIINNLSASIHIFLVLALLGIIHITKNHLILLTQILRLFSVNGTEMYWSDFTYLSVYGLIFTLFFGALCIFFIY